MRQWMNLFEGKQFLTKDGRPITINHFVDDEESTDYYEIIDVYAQVDGDTVGSGKFDTDEGSFRGIHVDDDFRRQGIATAIYDYVENYIGYVRPSQHLEPDGELFWAARRRKLKEEEVQEAFDEDDLDGLPEDERWLRKYLHQGLNRWPNEWVIDSLLSKRSNDEPLEIYRGMNFREQESMDEFVNDFAGVWEQPSGISSWSPDHPTALEFAYVRKTYYPDEETFRQEKIARETGEKMRGVGGVLLKIIAPPNTVIEFDGGYESEVLLTPGVYKCEMEVIKPYRDQIKDGFDINAYILSLEPKGRLADSIEAYIRQNHIEDLTPKARAHLFKLDGGDRLAETSSDIAPIAPWSRRESLYEEELRFWYNADTLAKAAEGFYGPTGVKLAKAAAKKIFADFARVEKQHPDAKLYMQPMGLVVELSGMQSSMKDIVRKRFAEPYHELNRKFSGPMNDDVDWPKGGLVTIKEYMKELFAQYSILTS